MSPDGSSVGVFSTDHIGKIGYSLGFSIGILLLVTTILLASYLCNRSNSTTQSPHRRSGRPVGETREAGLDENILMSYPKLLYSQARLGEMRSMGSCCSICLADYKETDVLRGLPDCSHMFHLSCIDPWLRLHRTCPLCRASPLPTPLPTPLAEVAPLAGQS